MNWFHRGRAHTIPARSLISVIPARSLNLERRARFGAHDRWHAVKHAVRGNVEVRRGTSRPDSAPKLAFRAFSLVYSDESVYDT